MSVHRVGDHTTTFSTFGSKSCHPSAHWHVNHINIHMHGRPAKKSRVMLRLGHNQKSTDAPSHVM